MNDSNELNLEQMLQVVRRDAPLTILLIDDDEDCRTLVRDAIRASGLPHRIVEHDNGQSAIDYLLQTDADSRPDLIFLDIEMPQIDGLQTLARIRNERSMRDIPIVMLSGVADEEHIRRAAALGANSYTVKPARADQFFLTVLTSAHYWLTVHQAPGRHLPQAQTRR